MELILAGPHDGEKELGSRQEAKSRRGRRRYGMAAAPSTLCWVFLRFSVLAQEKNERAF
jgi:hypothetical protein